MCDNKNLARKRLRTVLITDLIVFAAEVVSAVLFTVFGTESPRLLVLAIILLAAVFFYFFQKIMEPSGQYFFDHETVSFSTMEGYAMKWGLVLINIPFSLIFLIPTVPLLLKISLAFINLIVSSRKDIYRIYRLSKGQCACKKGKMSSKWITGVDIPHLRRGHVLYYHIVLFEPDEGKAIKVAVDRLTYMRSKSGREAVVIEYEKEDIESKELYVDMIPV